MSEKELDEGEILKALVRQGAFDAARAYVDFLEKKALDKEMKKGMEIILQKEAGKEEAEESESEGGSAEGEEVGEG